MLNKFHQVFNVPRHKISVQFSPIRSGFSKMIFAMVQVGPGLFKDFGPVLNFSNLVGPGRFRSVDSQAKLYLVEF